MATESINNMTTDNIGLDNNEKTLVSFDYAIKYLLKDKSGYDIVEGFISALLVSEGYGRVKIKSLLETESNKEARDLKKSVADVVVEDEEGSKYIVEIDRSYTSMFLHKACFNSSRLIVDNISSSDDYSTIKKVFHINLLYFPIKNMQSPLYHGKTIFHEIDRNHPQNIHLVDMGMKAFDSYNVFPEYFVISVPMFNDIIKDEIDEWLYLIKHSKVQESFKSPYMKMVAERLSILTMTKEERAKYRAHVSETLKERDYLVSAEEKGREEGREEGIEIGEAKGREEGIEIGEAKGIKLTATNMLKQKLADSLIMQVTGLSKEELDKLKNKI